MQNQPIELDTCNRYVHVTHKASLNYARDIFTNPRESMPDQSNSVEFAQIARRILKILIGV